MTFETFATIDGIDDVPVTVIARVIEDDDGSQPYRTTFPMTADILEVTETFTGQPVALDDDLYEQFIEEAVAHDEAQAEDRLMIRMGGEW